VHGRSERGRDRGHSGADVYANADADGDEFAAHYVHPDPHSDGLNDADAYPDPDRDADSDGLADSAPDCNPNGC